MIPSDKVHKFFIIFNFIKVFQGNVSYYTSITKQLLLQMFREEMEKEIHLYISNLRKHLRKSEELNFRKLLMKYLFMF